MLDVRLVIGVGIDIFLVFLSFMFFVRIFCCFLNNIVTGLNIACKMHGESQEKQTSRVVLCWLVIRSLKTVPNMSVYMPDSLFQEQLGVRRSYLCRSQ